LKTDAFKQAVDRGYSIASVSTHPDITTHSPYARVKNMALLHQPLHSHCLNGLKINLLASRFSENIIFLSFIVFTLSAFPHGF